MGSECLKQPLDSLKLAIKVPMATLEVLSKHNTGSVITGEQLFFVTQRTLCRMTKTHEEEMKMSRGEAEDRQMSIQRATDRKLKETLVQYEQNF